MSGCQHFDLFFLGVKILLTLSIRGGMSILNGYPNIEMHFSHSNCCGELEGFLGAQKRGLPRLPPPQQKLTKHFYASTLGKLA